MSGLPLSAMMINLISKYISYNSYLETGGKGATIRPWVWIIWLFMGPTVGSIAFQWYIFIAVRWRVT